jgi:hypothetical protein
MAFELPIKGDLDRVLSTLMHDARHKLMIDMNRVTAEASKAGMRQSSRTIVVVASLADQIHAASLKQATPILHDFIARLSLPPTEIAEWARPHLENLGNNLIGLIPPNGLPNDHKRIVAQCQADFTQRLDGMLRDVEIGLVEGSGFAGATKVGSEEEWVSAAAAAQLLKPVLSSETAAQRVICERAHAGLIRARAAHFLNDNEQFDNYEIPKGFWWAEGGSALQQRWATGDFDTWIRNELHLKAFGVSFLRSDIERMIPPEASAPAKASQASPSFSDTEEKILRSLTDRLPLAALSYQQALFDLADTKRVSFRGSAHELREAVREVLDQLAPDGDVMNAPGFMLEKDRNKPTMKQKVRFILKARKRGSTESDTTEHAADTIDALVASMTRSVYDRGSRSAHSERCEWELAQLKCNVDAILHDLLEL